MAAGERRDRQEGRVKSGRGRRGGGGERERCGRREVRDRRGEEGNKKERGGGGKGKSDIHTFSLLAALTVAKKSICVCGVLK